MPQYKFKFGDPTWAEPETAMPWHELRFNVSDLYGMAAIQKLTNDDMNDDLRALAVRYLADIRAAHLERIQPDFIRAVIRDERISRGQARGVLNLLAASIRGQRRRFWKSRDKRGGECVVCGAPLEDDESLWRGVGPVCYRRVMGDW